MLIVLDEVDSTNTWAKEHFFELADGTVVAALEQTAGRGRLDRVWRSKAGRSITLSALFRRVSAGFHAGAIVGLAALEVIRALAPETEIYFKWPNDLYFADRKLAGVLSEGVVRQGELAGVVCGIGINLNQTEKELLEIGAPACSVYTISGRKNGVKKVIKALEKSITECYINYCNYPEKVLARFRAENRLIGTEVELVGATGEVFRARFRDLDADGGMVIERGGRIERFDCGDVRIVVPPETANQCPVTGGNNEE